jgi:hypothetical protein
LPSFALSARTVIPSAEQLTTVSAAPVNELGRLAHARLALRTRAARRRRSGSVAPARRQRRDGAARRQRRTRCAELEGAAERALTEATREKSTSSSARPSAGWSLFGRVSISCPLPDTART